jgi:hypothetical protein
MRGIILEEFEERENPDIRNYILSLDMAQMSAPANKEAITDANGIAQVHQESVSEASGSESQNGHVHAETPVNVSPQDNL